MPQIKRQPFVMTQVERDRLQLVTVISGNIMGSLCWSVDNGLYQVQDGQWYRLYVEGGE